MGLERFAGEEVPELETPDHWVESITPALSTGTHEDVPPSIDAPPSTAELPPSHAEESPGTQPEESITPALLPLAELQ
jgi:hypothetical protein